jgi:aldehyde dehydrogenase (NAD+)
MSDLVERLRATYATGRTRPVAWREAQLRAILAMLRDREDDILGALAADSGKPAIEGWISDSAAIAREVTYVHDHLERWMRPERASLPAVLMPGRARIVREPLGVVLVIAPWNYPVALLLRPFASAIAAGNAVVGKPSEVTPATSATLARIVPEFLDTDAIAVVEGAVPETTALLEQRFDHVLYTGNGRVGRVVMEAAAKHLTPVTLELGGKSPTIVAADADLAQAARQVAFGKFFNAGQTCIAPDYILVEEPVHDAFLDELTRTVRGFYGDDPKTSPDYGRIVNQQHHRRLSALLDAGGFDRVVMGGERDEADRYLAPTVLDGVSPDSEVMADEIFGPILPVLSVGSVDEAIAFVNVRPKPLALYLFTRSEATERRVVARTSSGAVDVNVVAQHWGAPQLPFGGVGASGMGAYHGRHGFETFSHRKPVLAKDPRMDPRLLQPPYTARRQKLLRSLVPLGTKRRRG